MNLLTFIEKSKKIHGEKFDYSRFEYTGSKKKSTLICNTCNSEFLSTPSNHLIGSGCKSCFEKNRSLQVTSNKLKLKYPDWTFNFENYLNSDSNIEYTCSSNHNGVSSYRNMIRFNVCKKCCELTTLENKKIKIKSKGFDIIKYIDDKKIECKCTKCEFEFENSYRNLMNDNFKCRYCDLIEQSDLIKMGKVKLLKIGDYGNSINIHLQCNKGHIYIQNKGNLLENKACNLCRKENSSPKKEDIFEILNKIHAGFYIYDENSYVSVRNKINITCKKGHNFQQRVSNHLQGKGCPICRESFGERMISKYLDNKKINFIRQKKFTDCKNISHLPFDFYLIDLNMCIEYDGIQHFQPISLYGGVEEFERTKIRDEIKNEYCRRNGINLIRISFRDNIEEKLNDVINYK